MRRADLRAERSEEPSVSQGGVETMAQNQDLRSRWTVRQPCLMYGVCPAPRGVAGWRRWPGR